ncbi:MAG: Gldg family protein [Candidatus Hydrogenedentota bacterium]
MRNILSIMRRDLTAYFTSPIGYIYMMVFVTVSVGLYVTSFFGSPFLMVDIRPFFDNIPLLLCVLVPAITMRVWAEERKENTWEMLLTLPMRAHELVLGKFLACMIFFAAAVFATITVPWMLVSLGEPDFGVIIGGYVGILLVGAMFFALGILFSGFFKDQIVAFVITLLACLLLFLVGTNFIAGYLDGAFESFKLGSLLSELLGVFTHYGPFIRGVVDLADVLYFAAWTIILLGLNVMYIDGRNRPGARLVFGAALVLTLGIGMLFNWLVSDTSWQRLDLTENKIYTVSEASKNVLQELETPVTVNVYITPSDEMPTAYRQLERDITDKLEEIQVASEGNLRYKVLHMHAANIVSGVQQNQQEETDPDLTEEEKIEERMYEKGVEPFSVQSRGEAGASTQLVYSSLGISYQAQEEEIIPQVVPQNLPDLEYRVISTVYKLTRDELPKVALVAPEEAINIPPEMRSIYEQMGQEVPDTQDPFRMLRRVLEAEKYRVERVAFSEDEPLPDDYDTLVIMNPRGFNERHRWEIDRALRSGKSVILAVQQYLWDYRPTRNQLQISRSSEEPGVNELLAEYGVSLSEHSLMDVNTVPLTISQGLFGQQIDLPLHIMIQSENMNQDTAITNNLSTVFYLWGSALDINEAKIEENGLDHTVLMTTSERAWEETADPQSGEFSVDPPAEPDERQRFPVAVQLKGQFPGVLADEERPEWPEPPQQPGQPPMPDDDEPEPPAESIEPAPANFILMGCSETFKDDYLQVAGGASQQLLFKMVDAITLREDIAEIRSRTPVARTIDKPEASTITKWQVVNYGLANVIIAAAGIAVMTVRRQRRNAYTMAYAANK